MDNVIAQLLTFPPVPAPAEPLPDTQYEALILSNLQVLNNLPNTKLTSELNNGEDVLDILDPSKQTNAYLYALCAQIEASQTGKPNLRQISPSARPEGQLWPRITKFLEVFDPIQVRYAGSRFRYIVELVCRGAQSYKYPLSAIPLVRHAILRLDPTSSTLTSTHLAFLQLCLQAEAYREALPILDRTIYHLAASVDDKTLTRTFTTIGSTETSSWAYLNPKYELTTRITARSYLEYHIYAGTICLGLKRWDKAMEFFAIVLQIPCNNKISKLVVEAYKKWLLAGVLLKGETPSLPKGMSKNTGRSVQALAKPYDCLVEAFVSGDKQKLQTESKRGAAVWCTDHNLGLVMQVYEASRKFAVSNLAKVYTSLPLQDVAQKTSPYPTDLVETAAYLSSLIASGELKATLTQETDDGRPSFLRFSDPVANSSEHDLNRDIQIQQAELAIILKHIQEKSHRLEVTRGYIEKMRGLKKSKEQTARNMESSKAAEMLEEDVMADMA